MNTDDYRKRKNMTMWKTMTGITLAAAMTATMGCTAFAADSAAESFDENMSGKVAMAGSTSMEKLASALQEAFMEKYPNVTVTAEFTGSSAGIESLEAGSVDIGNASRALSDDEKKAGIVENVVAIDGIGVITDKDNKVKNVSADDLKKIYSGEITNWKDLGGDDEAIVVIGREAGSGTRSAFEELLELQDKCKYASELDSTGAIDDVAANEENILAGKYLLQRPFVMGTMGEISKQSKPVQAFFAYLNSDEGQKVIKSVGLIIPKDGAETASGAETAEASSDAASSAASAQ